MSLCGDLRGPNGKKAGGLERGAAPRWRIKALKVESQERHRDETSPDGVVGCKPARACETLRPEGGGRGWPADCSKGQRSCRKV